MSKRFGIFLDAFTAGVPDGAPAVAYQSLVGSASAFAAAALAVKSGGVVVAIASGLPEADSLYSDLESIADEAGIRVLEFPPEIEGDRSSTAARLKVSAALGAYSIRPYPLVIVAPVMALAEGVAGSETVQEASIELSLPGYGGAVPSFADVQAKLLAAGYGRVVEVTSPGEFSVRGGVLDAWSPGDERPIRAEFFGDELESLRVFDPATQISIRKIETARMEPVAVGLGESREEGKSPKDQKTLFELLPPHSLILALDHNSYAAELSHMPTDGFRKVFTGDPAPRGVPTAPFSTAPLPGFAEQRITDPLLVDRVREGLKKFLSAERRRGSLVVEDDVLLGGFACEGLVVVARTDRIPGAKRRHSAVGRKESVAHSGERLGESMDIVAASRASKLSAVEMLFRMVLYCFSHCLRVALSSPIWESSLHLV